MKKLIALLLALTVVMGLAACGATTGTPETTEAVEKPANALEILTTIWEGVAEEKRFFAMGGGGETVADNAPGNYPLDDEGISSILLVPQEELANIDDAASLVHAMMLNNFTAGAFHVTGDANAFAEAMHTAIAANRWMCGMPEHLTIAVIGGEYVLVYFGINDALEGFTTSFKAAYPNAEIKYDEAITE